MNNNNYTITVYPPETDIQLWSVWCKELELGASGETENEAFYNLVENLPTFFEIKNEIGRTEKLRKHKLAPKQRTFQIPAYA